MQTYDIIGDIHGYGLELCELLEKLGYELKNGVYTPPEQGRMAVFLGDYIDRGAENFEVIDLVRNMVDAGYAHAIMGNHDLNCGMFNTRHPEDGAWLRPHRRDNILQHQAFLTQAARNTEQAAINVNWLKSLPVYLELDGLRFVHAMWDPAAMKYLHDEKLLRDDHTIDPDRWHELAYEGTPGCTAIELLTKGEKIALPPNVSYQDADGQTRRKARLKWWVNPDNPDLMLHEVIVESPKGMRRDIPVPETVKARIRELQRLSGATVFFGHYWQEGATPTVEYEHAICLDQSVALNGHLAAATVTVDHGKIVERSFHSVKSRPPMHQPATEHALG